MEETVRDRIRAALERNPDGDRFTLADEVLAGYRTKAELIAACAPIVAEEVDNARRHIVRRLEATTERALRKVRTDGGDPMSVITDLLSERFFNGTEYVTWGEATVPDHLARIAFLQKQVSGIVQTIQRHQNAIDLLSSSAGATCLNDVDRAVVANAGAEPIAA